MSSVFVLVQTEFCGNVRVYNSFIYLFISMLILQGHKYSTHYNTRTQFK